MDGIGKDVWVRVGIQQGQIYNFSPEDEVDNHYYVVLNKNPKSDTELYLAMFTTQKDHARKLIELRRLGSNTLVEVKNGECSFLPRSLDSVINCNFVLRISIDDLILRIEQSNGTVRYPTLEEGFMNRVKEGILASRLISPVIKLSL